MTKFMQRQAPFAACLLFLTCFSALFLYSVLGASQTSYLRGGWEYSWHSDAAPPPNTAWHPFEPPGQPPGRNGQTSLWLRVSLPPEHLAVPALYVKYVRQSFTLYLDQQPLYAYDDPAQQQPAQYTPFYPWHLIPLPSDAAGKYLYFHIQSTGPVIGIMSPVQYASLFYILSDKSTLDLFKISSAVLSFFLGLFALLLYLRDPQKKLYLMFTGTAILGSLVVFSSTFACMLLYPNALFWSRLLVIAGSFWPTFLLQFLSYIASAPYNSWLQRWSWVITVLAATGSLLFCWQPQTIPLIYLSSLALQFFNYGFLLYIFRYELRTNREAQIYLFGSTIWSFTLAYDALTFLAILPPSRTPISSLGQFFDLLALAAILLLRYVDVQRQLQHSKQCLEQQNRNLQTMQHTLQHWNQNLEITVQERTAELLLQQTYLQQLFEQNPDAAALVDMNYVIIDVNPACAQLLAVPRDELTGQPLVDYIAFAPEADVASKLATAVTEGHAVQLETTCRLFNGAIIEVALTAYPLLTLNHTHMLHIMYRDISTRKAAEQLLQASEQKYRLIAENTSDVIWLMDPLLNLTYVSPSVEKLLGISAATLLLQPAFERTFPLTPAAAATLRQTIQDGSYALPLTLETEHILPSGTAIWTESKIDVTHSDTDAPLGFLGITRNITERKQTEQLLQHAYNRKNINDFFQLLLHRPDLNEHVIQWEGLRRHLILPSNFSLYFLQITPATAPSAPQQQALLDAALDVFNTLPDTLAWECNDGMGILHAHPDDLAATQRLEHERSWGQEYWHHSGRCLPQADCRLGIADYASGFNDFGQRFRHAQSAIRTGILLVPQQAVYHYEDGGVYQILDYFAASNEAQTYVQRTLGPLLEYDAANHTDLLPTLEKILLTGSLKEAAEQMFFHHKTLLSRKQRIEKILEVSLDSFEARMALGAAIHLAKLLPPEEK